MFAGSLPCFQTWRAGSGINWQIGVHQELMDKVFPNVLTYVFIHMYACNGIECNLMLCHVTLCMYCNVMSCNVL